VLVNGRKKCIQPHFASAPSRTLITIKASRIQNSGRDRDSHLDFVAKTSYIVSQIYQEKIMATSAMVHVRVDEKVKAEATEMLAAMGLSVSDAVRVFLMRVIAEKQLPFALKVPNAETRAAMLEADEIVTTRRARFATANELFNDLEKNSGK
jgi:DNA-damage-inducible protein J